MSTRATRVQSKATGNRTESEGLVTPAGTVAPTTPLDILANVALQETRTRFGRVSRPPVRYEPVEQVEDDYAPEDYDTDESSICSDDTFDDDEDEDDESDADEDGNLDGFVVPDKSETSDSESDGEPPVPSKRRAVVKKRPATARK